MNRSLRLFVVALALVAVGGILGVGSALAETSVCADSCTAELFVNNIPVSVPTPISMLLVPDGSGTPFTNCYLAGGIRVNAKIVVTLKDASGNPVAGVHPLDVRLEEMDSPLTWCEVGGNYADGESDASGVTEFTWAYCGGGWVIMPTNVWVLDSGGSWMPIENDPLLPLSVSYNSTDINGDRVVNLQDVARFASDFYSLEYNYRSDFNFDGNVNLLDVPPLARTYGNGCP